MTSKEWPFRFLGVLHGQGVVTRRTDAIVCRCWGRQETVGTAVRFAVDPVLDAGFLIDYPGQGGPSRHSCAPRCIGIAVLCRQLAHRKSMDGPLGAATRWRPGGARPQRALRRREGPPGQSNSRFVAGGVRIGCGSGSPEGGGGTTRVPALAPLRHCGRHDCVKRSGRDFPAVIP